MRHILAALIVGAALGFSASAALAYGDNVDYPGVGLHQNQIAPGVVFQSQPSGPSVAAGEPGAKLWLIEMRDQNIVR
jgi:hypothetical protein